jgi:hypothetical protein
MCKSLVHGRDPLSPGIIPDRRQPEQGILASRTRVAGFCAGQQSAKDEAGYYTGDKRSDDRSNNGGD